MGFFNGGNAQAATTAVQAVAKPAADIHPIKLVQLNRHTEALAQEVQEANFVAY
jgi:hypothetical protein